VFVRQPVSISLTSLDAEQRHNRVAVETPRQKSGLNAEAVHALSNHLAVILGFIELVLTDTSEDDPRRGDLLEIRQAAHECARIVSGSHTEASESLPET
jgi:hypothetical protein